MPASYTLNCGQYVQMLDGRPVRAVVDEVGLAFDKEIGALYRHGEASAVRKWTQERQTQLRADGCEGMADNLVCLAGRLPLEELNACLANPGRLPGLYEKALRGELAPEPLPAPLPLRPAASAASSPASPPSSPSRVGVRRRRP